MKRYEIKRVERTEISKQQFKKYGNLVDAFVADGMNCTADSLGVFDDRAKALASLENYKCSAHLVSGYANVKFYEADMIYLEEQSYNEDWEEWESTGNYDFAKTIKKIKLTQDAYVCGYEGAFYRFTTKDGKRSCHGIWNNWYEGTATDEDGKDYKVIWEITDRDAFDAGDEDCCDWDNPAEILDDEGNTVTDECVIVD